MNFYAETSIRRKCHAFYKNSFGCSKRKTKFDLAITNRVKNKVVRVSLWELLNRIFENEYGTHFVKKNVTKCKTSYL